MRIALGLPNLIHYPQGGGHWMFAIQYFLALQGDGHKVLCLFFDGRGGEPTRDAIRAQKFIARFRRYCPGAECCVVTCAEGQAPNIANATFYGLERSAFGAWAKSADMLWNLAGTVPNDFLDLFQRRVFIDGDPGHFHVCALQGALNLENHDRFLSVGLNLGYRSCQVPLLGKTWATFPQVTFLEMWEPQPKPETGVSFTSITHWNWDELNWNGKRLSCSKREAYFELLALPHLSGCRMSLAANLGDPEDKVGDRRLFEGSGWSICDAWNIASNPRDYIRFISQSRAEICAPKPIYVDLNTGWISDRSAGYLATGRPVLMKETGVSEHLPTGRGLVTFHSIEEAAERAKEIEWSYAEHAKAAREFAEEYLDSRKVVPRMLESCE